VRVLLGLLCCGLLAGCGTPTATPSVALDTPALRAIKAAAGIADCPTSTGPTTQLPDVSLPCLGGGAAVPLRSLKGPVVLNLWSETCGPCRQEMPVFQAFSQKYVGRVAVIGVDYDDYQPALALKFAKEVGVTYPLVADLKPSIQASALPTTIVIDSQGRVVYNKAAVFDSLASLERAVGSAIGGLA